MSRPTFRQELISSLFAGLGTGAIIPQFTQLFARKGLYAPDWIIALLLAEVTLGNLFGVLWVKLLEGRRRVLCVAASRVTMGAAMLAVAMLPTSPGMAVPYALILILPAMLAAVVLNVSASVQHSNYPAGTRGQIVSRLLIVRLAATIASVKIAGYALDTHPGWAHRAIYPGAALAMIISGWAYSRIRVRREKTILAESNRRALHPLAGFQLLRKEPAYGRFMLWQMFSAATVLMVAPVLVLHLTDVWKVTYGSGTTALAVVPIAVIVLTVPLFGRMFDAISITRFRALGAAFWASSRVIIFVAISLSLWPVALFGFAVEGLGRATGALAFSIGHTRFSRPSESQLYMGIHMTLQGMRGLTMPFVGVWLYRLIGIELVLICAVLQFVAASGFALMKAAATAEATPPPTTP
ncbi:MAG: MFS transporter [Planctomycetota bacterium]